MCQISLQIRLIILEHRPEHNGLDATIQGNNEILKASRMHNTCSIDHFSTNCCTVFKDNETCWL